MEEYTARAALDAIRDHPEIVLAAVTGSRARPSGADRYSDLDLLLVARDVEPVRDVRSWFPRPERILPCAFHFTHYCTILLEGFEKVDMAIFSADAPPSAYAETGWSTAPAGLPRCGSSRTGIVPEHLKSHRAGVLVLDLGGWASGYRRTTGG